MKQNADELRSIVREAEAVFAKHGVSGAVVVASEHYQYYGVFYPEGSPVRLEGHNDVRIDWNAIKHPRHRAFLGSLSGLAEASKTIANTCGKMWTVVLSGLQDIKRRGEL